ncbi:MAG: DUF2750 domain-containing protein [Saprospirales bacterium]|nr:DUF2750 domain-containing protein [Saprospirales bacterium]MBK8920829.1 DUF2750 domain-containing protein [Saprospirales bacterium]
MNPTDIEKLFKKPGEKRYDYFIKQVVENEEVFGLADVEGWALLGDDSDADILPLFPSAELAEAFRLAVEFDEYQVEALDVNELMDWFDEMEADNLLVAVCPNPELNGAVVDPKRLKTDLQTAFDKEVE